MKTGRSTFRRLHVPFLYAAATPTPQLASFCPPPFLTNIIPSPPPLPSHEIHATAAAEDKKVPSAIFALFSPPPPLQPLCLQPVYRAGREGRGECRHIGRQYLTCCLFPSFPSPPPLRPWPHNCALLIHGRRRRGGQILERESGRYSKIGHKWGKYSFTEGNMVKIGLINRFNYQPLPSYETTVCATCN